MYTIAGFFSVGIVLFIRTFVATPFVLNGQSMEPNYHDKQYFISEKLSKDFNRGDIIIIEPGVDVSRQYYLTRIVGLPGETISFSGGQVLIKKKGENEFVELDESYLSAKNRGNTYIPEYISEKEFLIPNDSYWVMGDNRKNSADSRQCFQFCKGKDVSAHFIKKIQIAGKALDK